MASGYPARISLEDNGSILPGIPSLGGRNRNDRSPVGPKNAYLNTSE
jgi:hypothetical protein